MTEASSATSSSACPICDGQGEKVSDYIRGEKSCAVYHCETCVLGYLDRHWVQRDEFAFYNSVYIEELKPEKRFNMPEKLQDTRATFVRARTSAQTDLLEIGPGSGLFLERIRDHVASVHGCELNTVEASYIESKLGIKCFNGHVHDMPENQKFDAICAYQVFEHIAEPHPFLQELRSRLNPGGQLFIEVPNYLDPLYDLYKIQKFRDGFFFPEQHPLVYSPQALQKVMQENGFGHVKTDLLQTYSITNHLNWMYANTGNNSFQEGIDIGLPNMPDEEWRKIWEPVNALYCELLENSGHGDVIFSVFEIQ